MVFVALLYEKGEAVIVRIRCRWRHAFCRTVLAVVDGDQRDCCQDRTRSEEVKGHLEEVEQL